VTDSTTTAPTIAAVTGPPEWRDGFARNIAIATVAVAVFGAVFVSSGKVDAGDGLGWDGRLYARMVTDGLAAGQANTEMRPLVILAVRVVHATGLDVLSSFEVVNVVSAFVLYLFAALLLDRDGLEWRARAVVVANLALCIATSKMFGFYPVQVDLGALAVITMAFYFVATDRTLAAAVSCVMAVASREFGIAVVLYGIHRAVRLRRPWYEPVLTFGPSLATMVLIRAVVAAHAPAADAPLSAADALSNLSLWRSPAFAIVFAYFLVFVFGGVSALLVLRPGACLERLRARPELLSFLLPIVAMSAAGSLDIWRYLAFALPAVLVLSAHALRALPPARAFQLLLVTTVITVVTQRPFEHMNDALYFRDWFPLYQWFPRFNGAFPTSADLAPVWAARLESALLIIVAAELVVWRR
jgi:hypothetical protein